MNLMKRLLLDENYRENYLKSSGTMVIKPIKETKLNAQDIIDLPLFKVGVKHG